MKIYFAYFLLTAPLILCMDKNTTNDAQQQSPATGSTKEQEDTPKTTVTNKDEEISRQLAEISHNIRMQSTYPAGYQDTRWWSLGAAIGSGYKQ